MRIITAGILFLLSFSLMGQKPMAILPFEVINGHIYIQVSIDGSRPLRIAFDTGARANLLHEDIAKELGFEITGRQQVDGASETAIIELSGNHQMDLNGIKVDGESFLIMNLDHLGDEDQPMEGVIGGSILDEFITEINFDASEVRFYDRRSFKVPADFTAQRISLIPFRIPILTGTISLANGTQLQGPFLVDTGAALALRLNRPLVISKDLQARIQPNYPYIARVLNTQSTDFIGRLPEFKVLGHEFQGFPIRMATSEGGVSGRSDIDGIIGLEILKRFNLIFNYREQQLYFQPSLLYDAFFLENFSGLNVKKKEGKLWVEEVVVNSPAFEAGIQKGDLIVSVDGRKNLSRSEFMEYVHPLRKDVKLEVIRGEQTNFVNIKPRKII